jgi:hypothetical protein
MKERDLIPMPQLALGLTKAGETFAIGGNALGLVDAIRVLGDFSR